MERPFDHGLDGEVLDYPEFLSEFVDVIFEFLANLVGSYVLDFVETFKQSNNFLDVGRINFLFDLPVVETQERPVKPLLLVQIELHSQVPHSLIRLVALVQPY